MPENIGLPFTLYHTFSNMPLTEYWMALFKREEILEVFNRVFLRATSQNKSRRSAIWSEITLKLSAFLDVFIFNYLSAYNTFCSLGLMYRTCNILLLEQLLSQYVSGDNILFPPIDDSSERFAKRNNWKFSPVHQVWKAHDGFCRPPSVPLTSKFYQQHMNDVSFFFST